MAKSFKKSADALFVSVPEEQPETPKAAADSFTAPKGYRLVREQKSERMQLLIRPTTKEAIKKAAQAQGISMNDLVNQLLDEYAERQGNA